MELSLLNEDAPLRQLEALLLRHGAQTSTVVALKRAIHFHNQELRYDRSALGAMADGWYRFDSVDSLLQAMPYPFFLTPTTSGEITQHNLACIDTAALVLRDHAANSLSPASWSLDCGLFPRLPWQKQSYALPLPELVDGETLIQSPGEAYPILGYRIVTGQSERSPIEEGVWVGLYGMRQVDWSPQDALDQARRLITAKLEDLQQHGISMRGSIQPVLLHVITPASAVLSLEHIGLLIQDSGSVFYLEKNGSSGPFVFVRAENEAVVESYVWRHYLPYILETDSPLYTDALVILSRGMGLVHVHDGRLP